MGRYGEIDFAIATKRGFLFGTGLFVAGVLGEALLRGYLGSISGWQDAMFLDLEIVGVLLMLLVPFVFGILLPLTD